MHRFGIALRVRCWCAGCKHAHALVLQSKVEMDQLVSRAAAEKADNEGRKTSFWHQLRQVHVIKPIVIMNVYNLLMVGFRVRHWSVPNF